MSYFEDNKIITKADSYLRKFCQIIYSLVIVYVGIFVLRLISAPDIIQVQYTPDDGYYYLILAKNFVHSKLWTFDTHNLTTGFHVLWAYLLAVVYWIGKPSDSQFYRMSLVLSLVIIISSLLFIGWDVTKQKGAIWGLLTAAVLISSSNFLFNTVSLTEWCLVIICAYLCFSRSQRTDRGSGIVLFIAALIGSLSRTDFILLPFAIFTTSLIVFYFERDRNVLLRGVITIGGTILGLILVGINNYAFTGNFLQSSALIKAYWTKAVGLAFLRSMLLTSDLLGFSRLRVEFGIIVFVSISVITLYFLIKAIWIWDKKRIRELAPAIVAGITFLGYSIIYLYNGAIQPWYTGNLLIPIWALGVIVLKYIWEHYNRWIRIIVSLILLTMMTYNIYSTITINSKNSPWPHQQYLLEAGKYLKLAHLDGAIASWNAGIISYYEGGTVINIDGLVNNNVYSYISNNNLYGYLVENKIRYIVDYENMVDDIFYRLRGGYDDERFLNSLHPLKVFGDGQYYWRYLTLYQVTP